MFPHANILIVWVGLLLGMVSGAVMGMCFVRENWLGGYGSWPRRMVRLGHISFFGLGFVNLVFVVTLSLVEVPASAVNWAGGLFVAGFVLMPMGCFLAAAWRKSVPWLFFPPVGCLLGGTAIVLWHLAGGWS